MRYLSILFFVSLITNAQIKRIEPPFWWEGMNDSKLQVLLYGDNIARYNVKSKGMDLVNVERVENENYLLNFNLSFQKRVFTILICMMLLIERLIVILMKLNHEKKEKDI